MPGYGYELRFGNHDGLTDKIKGWRAFLLRRGASDDYLFIHRRVEVEHDYSQLCICDPVVISNADHRPSLYFAYQIHYPVLH